MFPTLPNDVSLLIACKSCPLHGLARLMRVSRAWRDTLAKHVARITSTDVFYERLLEQLAYFKGFHYHAIATGWEEMKLRQQLQNENGPRFASLCLLLGRHHELEGKLRVSITIPLMGKLRSVFVNVFTKRGVMRSLITWMRQSIAIAKLDKERPIEVKRLKEKREAAEANEARLESIDRRRGESVEKKRKLGERLGIE